MYLKETIIYCREQDVRYIITGMIQTALEKIEETDARKYLTLEEYKANSTIIPLINSCIYIIMSMPAEKKKLLDQLFRIFNILSTLGPFCKQYLFEQKIIGVIILYIFENKFNTKDSKDTNYYLANTNNSMDLGNIQE